MELLKLIPEGFRIYFRSIRVKFRGFERIPGSAERKCEQIIKRCWNGEYFTTSLGHFKQFWVRDTAMVAEALIKLGHKKKLIKTLHFALNSFQKNGGITTHIRPDGTPVEFPEFTPESVACIVHMLMQVNNKALTNKYKTFIESEAKKAFDQSIDKKTGLVRSDKKFSTMKDCVIRKSPIYLNCMIGMLSNDLNKLKLKNPFKKFDYKKLLIKHFWTGSYFVDDLSGSRYVSGDANTFPFWTGIIKNKKMFESCLSVMQDNYLDRPLPLQYTQKSEGKFLWVHQLFTPNYEGNTIWLHLGICFLEVVFKFKQTVTIDYLEKYDNLIIKYGTFPEVLNPNGTPYNSSFYYCDEGMLWCAGYLRIKKESPKN